MHMHCVCGPSASFGKLIVEGPGLKNSRDAAQAKVFGLQKLILAYLFIQCLA